MKKIYITTGTYDFLKKLYQKNQNELLTLMNSNEHALLLHESNRKKSIFQVPRKYEVLEEVGSFPDKGFAVFHFIPVLDESRPVFEHTLNIRPRVIELAPGYLATRILRPIKNDNYLVITCWESEKHFDELKGLDPVPLEISKANNYPRPSYLKYYYIADSEENE